MNSYVDLSVGIDDGKQLCFTLCRDMFHRHEFLLILTCMLLNKGEATHSRG